MAVQCRVALLHLADGPVNGCDLLLGLHVVRGEGSSSRVEVRFPDLLNQKGVSRVRTPLLAVVLRLVGTV